MHGGWERQVAETAQRYQALQERLSRLSITESSGDGAVKVTVSASGQLTDLVLRERWHPDPLPAIAAEIMDCLRRAQARIPDLLRQAMVDTVGLQDPSAHLLVDEARRRFPEPVAEMRESHAPEPRRPVRESDAENEDDWDERAVMEDL
jgi:DNA-binding protein YbaB